MNSVPRTLQAGVDAHRAGNLAEAERLYKQVLTADGRNVDALRLLGLVAQAVGKLDLAKELIGQALKVQPRSAEAWNDLAGVYSQMGQLDQALEAYRKAIDARPLFASARNNLGELLGRLGRSEEALNSWREASRIDPTLPEPYYNIGRALFAQGKVNEAVDAYWKSIAAQPRYAPAHNNLGAVLWAMGKKKEASESVCRAVEIDPTYAEAWNNLGTMWDDGGKLDEAIECWTKAVRLRPGYADAHKNLGEGLHKKGARLAAIKEWEEALRLQPDWEELKYYLAAVKAGEGPMPTAPPAGYVARLFDDYADKFDEHLLGTLEYRVPALLVEAIKRTGRQKFAQVIDLGCGTGLCGEELRPLAGRLMGVDLSPKMIEKSRERGVYDELMVGGLQETMRGQHDLDLIVAGDVLGYVGDLGGVFAAARDAMRQGGHFVFSVEKPTAEEGEGFVLRKTRRFAHSRSYLEKLAIETGLNVVEISENIFRMDDRRPIEGFIVVLSK